MKKFFLHCHLSFYYILVWRYISISLILINKENNNNKIIIIRIIIKIEINTKKIR